MVLATVSPHTRFDIEAKLMLALSFAFVLLRCIVRIQTAGLRKLRLDDWGMKVAFTLFAFIIASAQLTAATTNIDPTVNPNNMPIAFRPGLANNGMTDDYRAALDPKSVEYQLRVAVSKLHIRAWSLYVSTMWCLKLCIAVFYTRLTAGLSHMKIRIQIAYMAIGVTYVVIIATLLGACRPFHRYWQINPNPGDQCMSATSALTCYTVVVLNVLTDLYLLHIPILMLWDAKISRVNRCFLIMLFSGGVFVIVASILRVYLTLNGGREGGAEAARWGIREVFTAFVIGNLPIIYGGVRIWLQKFKGPKVFANIRSMTKSRPGAGRINGLFSRAGHSRKNDTPKNSKTCPNCAIFNVAEPGYPSPQPWAHTFSGGRINADVKRSNTPRAETGSGLGIQITRGIKVDVESVKGNAGDLDATMIDGKHGRTDIEDQLGPYLANSPPGKLNQDQIPELPCYERQVHYSPDDPYQRRPVTAARQNGETWFIDDSP